MTAGSFRLIAPTLEAAREGVAAAQPVRTRRAGRPLPALAAAIHRLLDRLLAASAADGLSPALRRDLGLER